MWHICSLYNIYVGELVTLKSTLKDIRDNKVSFHFEKIHLGLCYMTWASTLGSMTTGDNVDRSLLCVSQHIWLVICLFPVVRMSYVEEILGSFRSENNNQEILLLICL